MTLPPEYTARPGAHGEGIPDASHDYLVELSMEDPVFKEGWGELAEVQQTSIRELFDRKARALYHVTIRVPVMAHSTDHARAQAVYMAKGGFGSHTLFELIKVEAPGV